MALTNFQKNILTFAGLGAVGFGVYYYIKRRGSDKPPLRILNTGQKRMQQVYDYFNGLGYYFSLDNSEAIQVASSLKQLTPNQLLEANSYYISEYSPITGITLLSDWLDDQYYTLGIFDDPLQSTIDYLKNKGL